MKVCIVNEFFKPYITGGVDVFLDNLTQFLLSKGFEVKLITSRMEGTKEHENADGLEIYRINSSPVRFGHFQQLPGITFPFNFFNYSLRSKVFEIMKDADCIHINNLYHLSFAPMQAAKLSKKKILLDVHDYWPICFRKDLLHPNNKTCFSNDPFTCYSCMSVTNPAFTPFGLPIFLEFHYRNSLVKTKNIITHSKFVHDKILEYNDMRSDVIPYPYVGEKSNKTKKIDGKLKILFMGRLQVQKGAHLLPEISRKLKEQGIDYEIDILGDGPLFSSLKSSAEKENLNMNFFGFVKSRPKIHAALKRSNLLLLPSLWHEAFGIVVLEAMAFGVPVIGSNLGGLKEVINENKAGFALNPNANEIVEGISSLIENPNLYRKFSSNGIKNIKKYDQKKIFAKYLNAFENF